MGDKKGKNVKLRLKDVMDLKGVNGKQLAELLGMNRENTVSDWVNDKTLPSIERLKKIADALEIEPVELLELSEDFEHIYNHKKQWKGILPKCNNE